MTKIIFGVIVTVCILQYSSGSILTLGTVQFRSLSQEPEEPDGLIRVMAESGV